MTYLWSGMILVGIVYGIFTGNLKVVTEAAVSSSRDAVSLCISMAGVVAMWSGLMKIAEMAGLVEELSQKMRPVVRFLFPGLEEESEAGKYISLNFLSNILGLGWAATPAGLKAMECLKQEQEGILSDKKMGNTAENVKFRDRRNITENMKFIERQSITVRQSITASREMCTFLIINISSLQLIPVNIIAYRMQYGSAEPTAVVAPAIVATAASTVVAVIFCKIMDRRDVA